MSLLPEGYPIWRAVVLLAIGAIFALWYRRQNPK